MRQATKEGLAILAGETRPDAAKQCLLDWITSTYGGKPINIIAHGSKEGVLGTLSVTWHRYEDAPGFRGGYPKYVTDAKKIYEQAVVCGVISEDTVLNTGFSVRGMCMQHDFADNIIRKTAHGELENIKAQLANPDITVLLYSFGFLRVFFETDALRDKYKRDEKLKAQCLKLFHDAIKAQDPEDYVTNLPGVSFESDQELRERYDGNLWQFFK